MSSKYYDYETAGYKPSVPFKVESEKTIEAFISEITRIRKAKAVKISEAIQIVDSRIKTLTEFKAKKALKFTDADTIRKNFAAGVATQQLDDFIKNFSDIRNDEIDKVLDQLTETKNTLETIYKRFNKDDVCIGIVGPKRKGKSSFIQNVTGVSNKVCPTSPRNVPCTGVSSIIRNRDQDNTTARITYYTMEEFEEIFELYKCTHTKYGVADDIAFGKEGFLHLYDSVRAADDPLGYSQRIKDYYDNFDRIVELIKIGVEEFDDEDEIEKKVAQTVGNKKYYDFLAVKKAEIFTRFLATDVKNLTLIDTIGLGEYSLGIDEKVTKTVAYESDLVILLTPVYANDLINGLDQNVDGKIKTLVLGDEKGEKVGLQAVESNKWLFILFNRFTGATDDFVNEKIEAFKEKYTTQVAGYINASCKNEVDEEKDPTSVEIQLAEIEQSKKELRERVIVPALQYIHHNIAVIDEYFEKTTEESLNLANDKWNKLVAKITTAVVSDSDKKNLINDLAVKKQNAVNVAFAELSQQYSEVPESNTVNNINKMIDNIENYIEKVNNLLPLVSIMTAYNSTKANIDRAFVKFETDAEEVCFRAKEEIFEAVKKITGLGTGITFNKNNDAFTIFSDIYFNMKNQEKLITAFKDFSDAEVNIGNVPATVKSVTAKYLEPNDWRNIPHKWNFNDNDIYDNIETVLREQQIPLIKKEFKAKVMLESPEKQIYNEIKSFLQNLQSTINNEWLFVYQRDDIAEVVFRKELSGITAATVQIKEWNSIVDPLGAHRNNITIDF